MKSIWILAHSEDHGDRGIVTELGYTGIYGTDSSPAFTSKEKASAFLKENMKYSRFKPMELRLV